MQMFSLAWNQLCSIVKIYTKMRKILILRSLVHEQEKNKEEKGWNHSLCVTLTKCIGDYFMWLKRENLMSKMKKYSLHFYLFIFMEWYRCEKNEMVFFANGFHKKQKESNEKYSLSLGSVIYWVGKAIDFFDN